MQSAVSAGRRIARAGMLIGVLASAGCTALYRHTCAGPPDGAAAEQPSIWCRALRTEVELQRLEREDPDAYCAAIGMAGTHCTDPSATY